MPSVSKGLEEGDKQKLHTTPPEQLTDEELLLSTFCVDDLQRKSSAVWDKQHPKCLFCRKPYRYRTFQVQCHMTSRIKGNTGSQGRVVEVCSMESKKDDGPEKARSVAVRRNLQAVHGPAEGQRPGCQFGSEKKYHTVGGGR